MDTLWVKNKAFTMVELLIVIVVIGILASLSLVVYRNVQKSAAEAAVQSDLSTAAKTLNIMRANSPDEFSQLTELPDSIRSSEQVKFAFDPMGGNVYQDLSPVQNGVLFYDVCEQLIADERFSTIHPKDGGTPQSVVMKCTDNINTGSILITGWDSKTWTVPLQKATIQNYINSVPYDNWWIDRQDVVRGFYTELINRFEQQGGVFPVTSFWNTWANPGTTGAKEELPAPIQKDEDTYCLEAYHANYPDSKFHITDMGRIQAGGCR